MEVRRRLLGMAVVALLLAGFAYLVLRPHGDLYQGRSLSFWLDWTHESGAYQQEGLTTPAEQALRERGTNAIPLLLEMAGTSLSGFRRVVGQLARDDSAAYLHLPPQLYKHDMAAWGFKLLGPEARPAVPALVRLLANRDAYVQRSGLQSLTALGTNASEAVPEVLKLFTFQAAQHATNGRRSDLMLYNAAAYALGEIGSAAAPAIPALEAETNEVAKVALIRIRGGGFDSFFAALLDTTNQDRWMRTAAPIYQLGTNAEAAIPYLIASLSATNDNIFNAAIQRLGQIHRRPDLCLPALTPLLNATDANARANVLTALSAFGPAAKPAFTDVARLLKYREEWIRTSASNTLLAIDPQAAARAGVKAITNDIPAHR